MDDVGRIGIGGEQRPRAPGRAGRAERHARERSRGPRARELVTEVHVGRRPPRATAGAQAPRRPSAQSLATRLVEHGRDADPVRHHEGDQLHESAASRGRAATDPPQHRVSPRMPAGSVPHARREQLGQIEGIAAGGREQAPRRPHRPGEGHRVAGQRRQLHELRAGPPGGRRARLAAGAPAAPLRRAKGEHEKRGQTGRSAGRWTPDRVERRVVGPVHVLENEHGRLPWIVELREQQRLDVVRRGALRRSASSSSGDTSPTARSRKRPERTRDGEVVAAPEQHATPGRTASKTRSGSRERSCRSPARR